MQHFTAGTALIALRCDDMAAPNFKCRELPWLCLEKLLIPGPLKNCFFQLCINLFVRAAVKPRRVGSDWYLRVVCIEESMEIGRYMFSNTMPLSCVIDGV